MDKEYVKGHLYKEIYRNEINGYMVGLFKIKETNTSFEDDIICYHLRNYLFCT